MILVINCGSQSIKWKIFSEKLEVVFQRKKEYFSLASAKRVIKKELDFLDKLTSKIEIVGHRVVWGRFYQPQEIRKEVLKEIELGGEIAPLHNPFQLLGIKIAKEKFKKAKHFAVFDSSFFKDLPAVSRLYPLPKEIVEKYQIFRLGFHGTSHKYLALKASEILKKPLEKLNLITLHLGGGASLTAIKKGKPIETSMGFSPLEGLTMTTRSGDLDPGILLFLSKRVKLEKLKKILNEESGLKAICGTSNFKEILEKKSEETELALKFFVRGVQKYLYFYFGLLKKVDALVFGGTVGYESLRVRKLILKDFPFKLPKVLKIKTDEEYQIAKEILSCLKKNKSCL